MWLLHENKELWREKAEGMLEVNLEREGEESKGQTGSWLQPVLQTFVTPCFPQRSVVVATPFRCGCYVSVLLLPPN